MQIINGGVTAPAGFKASGVSCGLKAKGGKDFALVVSERPAVSCGIFTKNVVKGHSLQLTMENIKSGFIKAVVINSGNANACVGEQGRRDAMETARLAAELLETDPGSIIFGSTGVIGKPLNMNCVRNGLKAAVSALRADGGHEAAEAIMTTDRVAKEAAATFEAGSRKVCIGGMAKGSGMIHPNMATMIGIITTDADISADLLDKALREVAGKTFNRISVDGDTSVCDMVVIMANGKAGNPSIVKEDASYLLFREGLEQVCTTLARTIARDGEGATKLVEIIVQGAASGDDANMIANAVAKSPLVKTTIFGEDANWGRVLTAVGYSGVKFDPDLVDIYIGDLAVCKSGIGLGFNEDKAREILKREEVKITVDMGAGSFSDRIWTCDFSYDYVKINASYRS